MNNKEEKIKNLVLNLQKADEAIKALREDCFSLMGETSYEDILIKLETSNTKWYIPFITQDDFNFDSFIRMKNNNLESKNDSMFEVTFIENNRYEAELIPEKRDTFLRVFKSKQLKNDQLDFIEFNDVLEMRSREISIIRNKFSFSLETEKLILVEPMKLYFN